MKFYDVKIDAQRIRTAAEKWCADWKPFVLYYLRNKRFITVGDAYSDFEDGNAYIEKERECDHCGSTYSSEEEESNPTVSIDDMHTLFRDLGDESIGVWLAACDEAGFDWGEQEVDLAWIMRKSWTYKELWSIETRYTDGSTHPLGEGYDSRDACIRRIEDRARYGYAYVYVITDPDGSTEEVDRREPEGVTEARPPAVYRRLKGDYHGVHCGHGHEVGRLTDERCSALATHDWISGNTSQPSFVCAEHLSAHGSEEVQAESAPAPTPKALYKLRTPGVEEYNCEHAECKTISTHSWIGGDVAAPSFLCTEHLPLYTQQGIE